MIARILLADENINALIIMTHAVHYQETDSGGDLAPNLGGRKKFRGPRFLNDLFSGKNSIFRVKISDDLVFRIFPFFSQIFRRLSLLC